MHPAGYWPRRRAPATPVDPTVTPDFQQFLLAKSQRRAVDSVDQLLKMLFGESSRQAFALAWIWSR